MITDDTTWFIAHIKSLTQSVIPTQSRCNHGIYQQFVNGRPAIYRTRSGQEGRASTHCDRIAGSHPKSRLDPIQHSRISPRVQRNPLLFARPHHFKILTQSAILMQSGCNQEIPVQFVDGRPASYRTRSGRQSMAILMQYL